MQHHWYLQTSTYRLAPSSVQSLSMGLENMQIGFHLILTGTGKFCGQGTRGQILEQWVNFSSLRVNYRFLHGERVLLCSQQVEALCRQKFMGHVYPPPFLSLLPESQSLYHSLVSIVHRFVLPSVSQYDDFNFKHLWNYLSIFHETSQKQKNLILSKALVALETKLKIIWNLWKSSCLKP